MGFVPEECVSLDMLSKKNFETPQLLLHPLSAM
jgi:hypothetical protein